MSRICRQFIRKDTRISYKSRDGFTARITVVERRPMKKQYESPCFTSERGIDVTSVHRLEAGDWL